MAFEFTPDRWERFQEILSHYPPERKQAAMLPTLHLAQEQNGYISPEVMEYVAQLLDVSPAQVLDVVTFYPMFFQEPVGKYIVRVCHTLPCALCGCRKIIEHLTEKLGIGMEETTPDGKFTLLGVECLAACNQGPVMMVNEELYGNLTPEKVDEILDGLE
ncbi:MAG: NADH-quinone oxidoreductase subunit E [Candidatus Poribacteria bacterium]|nr:MAG: NADH-quinone oxidoreductase subunit E [Candidatus Poribacteria bacterium]